MPARVREVRFLTWQVRFGVSLRRTLESGAEGDLGRHVYCEGGFHFANEQAALIKWN